jgi:hypothetical protein
MPDGEQPMCSGAAAVRALTRRLALSKDVAQDLDRAREAPYRNAGFLTVCPVAAIGLFC